MRYKKDLFRLTVNLPTRLVKELDRYAAGLSISRTTAIIVLLSNALNDAGHFKGE